METLIQRTIYFLSQENSFNTGLSDFLIGRKASELSSRTLVFYLEKLYKYFKICQQLNILFVTQITAGVIRDYILYMAEVRHNNKGNIHGFYRSLRAFLNWFENEYEPKDWRNPIKKVKAPKLSQEIIEPVSFDTINTLLEACIEGTFQGDRDASIILTLLDTGARASEFINIDLNDIDQRGTVNISHGKGDKSRSVLVGKKSMKAIRKYLKHRNDDNPALWVTLSNYRLTYDGLRAILTRRLKLANIPSPPLHGFRRVFALAVLRSGNVDVFSLQKLVGHTSLAIMRQYLAQNDEDTRIAHLNGSPVDRNIQIACSKQKVTYLVYIHASYT